MLYSLDGESKDALAKSKKGSWEYDIVFPGYKCNMTDILAGIGLVQLHRYSSLMERRKRIIKMYDEGLSLFSNTSLRHYGEGFASSGHLYLARIPGISDIERNQFTAEMAKAGVTTNVHYKPLPMFTAYRNLGFDVKDYPNAFDMYRNEITLPLHTALSDDDVLYVIEALKSSVNTVRGRNEAAATQVECYDE